MAGRECALRLALGEHEACPGSSCQLWHDGGCVLEAIGPELRSSPELAAHLLELKTALEGAATSGQKADSRSDFFRRLNQGGDR